MISICLLVDGLEKEIQKEFLRLGFVSQLGQEKKIKTKKLWRNLASNP